MTQSRLNLFIRPEHARRLTELAATKGVSKSSIVATALAAWLSPENGEQRAVATAKRLDRLSYQYDRLDRDLHILIETVALFVRYTLTVTPPIPQAHQDAARAQGNARFEQFIEHLGRRLARGHSLVKDVDRQGDTTPGAPLPKDDPEPATPLGPDPQPQNPS